jgi:hypothetical protein
VNDDTNYSPRPWMQNVPVQIKRPNPSYQDTITGQALEAAMGAPADLIRGIRPPIPVELFPERFGYRDEAIGIQDVVQVDDLYQRRDFSGRQSGYQGSSYPSLNQF